MDFLPVSLILAKIISLGLPLTLLSVIVGGIIDIKNKKFYWMKYALVLLGVIVLLLIIQIKFVYNTTSQILNTTTFQKLLNAQCSTPKEGRYVCDLQPSKINLDTLPVKIALDDLTRDKSICAWPSRNYVSIPLDDEDFVRYGSKSFITISDFESNHCCEGPSNIEPTGKLIKTDGSTNIYIHTGHWGEGPGVGYKPIIVRGVKTIKLSNGEEIKIVLDRIAIEKTDINLQSIENKYKVIDPYYETGEYIFTTETVEEMLRDSFFSNFEDHPVVSKVQSDLQKITLK